MMTNIKYSSGRQVSIPLLLLKQPGRANYYNQLSASTLKLILKYFLYELLLDADTDLWGQKKFMLFKNDHPGLINEKKGSEGRDENQNQKQIIELLAWLKGHICHQYILRLLNWNDFPDSQLKCLCNIFSGHHYSEDILTAACFTALNEHIFSFDGFEEVLTEVATSYRDYG